MDRHMHWAEYADVNYCVRAAFADGVVEFTTLEHAADLLDFIDRDKGISDMLAGLTFRSAMGAIFTIVSDDEAGAR